MLQADSDSVDLAWGLESAFLTSSQVMVTRLFAWSSQRTFLGGRRERVVFTALLNYKFEFSN